MHDLAGAVRALRRAPAVALSAFVVLTLGICASTVVYSVVDTTMLRRLPFERADRLVAVAQASKDSRLHGPVSPQDYLDWRNQHDVFAALAAVAYGPTIVDRNAPASPPIRSQRVSADLFPALGVAPLAGRVLTSGDEADGRDRVAVVSYGLWESRFGGDPAIVGRTIADLRGPIEIVGVMPPGFTYPVGLAAPPDLWMPWVPTPDERRRDGPGMSWYLDVVGRLKDGVTVDAAQARLREAMAPVVAAYPRFYGDQAVIVVRLADDLVGRVRPWMVTLLASVGLLLFLACLNVASLMLARATVRAREMAIRSALGASRWQIVRTLIVESLVLSMSSTAAGVLLAVWGVGAAKAALPAGIPRAASIAIDARVLAAAAAAAIITALVFGVLPALRASRSDPAAMLHSGGRAQTHDIRRGRAHGTLIAAETALAVTILVGTGLFVSSFIRLLHVDLGFRYHNVVAFGATNRIVGPGANQGTGTDPFGALLDRVRAVPGVAAAGVIRGGVPLSGSSTGYPVSVPGRQLASRDGISGHGVTPEYFRVVETPLLRGRLFDAGDRAGAVPVAILNDAAARRYFAGQDAVGQLISVVGTRTIVGIVANVRLGGPESDVRPEVYLPLAQTAGGSPTVVIRTDDGNAAAARSVAAMLAPPGGAMPQVTRFDDLFRQLTATRRFNMTMMTLLGLLACGIAAFGVFAVISYLVEQRTREIGVRIALGAQPAAIVRMILKGALLPVGAGAAAGLIAGWLLSTLVQPLLFQVNPHDPSVFVAVALTLLIAGLLAAIRPARRAARVDPLVALRAE